MIDNYTFIPKTSEINNYLYEKTMELIRLSDFEIRFLRNILMTLFIVYSIFYLIFLLGNKIKHKDYEFAIINTIKDFAVNLIYILIIIAISVIFKSKIYLIIILPISIITSILTSYNILEIIKKEVRKKG